MIVLTEIGTANLQSWIQDNVLMLVLVCATVAVAVAALKGDMSNAMTKIAGIMLVMLTLLMITSDSLREWLGNMFGL